MSKKIGDVASVLEVSTQSLRIWENEGIIPKATRNLIGHRIYSEQDIQSIENLIRNNRQKSNKEKEDE